MWQGFINWLKNPLDTQSGSPSAFTLFLFIGLLLVLLTAWALIFNHIRELA